MSVRYDTDDEQFVIDPTHCPDCDEELYVSACDAPGCNSLACQDCGTGCDLDFVDAEDGGRCASALEDEDEEDYDARINAERAAFGLGPAGAR